MAEAEVTSLTTAVEEWRCIPGFEAYEASSHGRVRRSSTGYVLKAKVAAHGYAMVGLYRGKNVQKTVHSCVCSAFYGPRPNGLHCAHNDGNPSNNRSENLRWCTRLENEADKRLHGTNNVGISRPNCKITEQQAIEIRAATGFQSDIARRYGIRQTHVSQIKLGRLWGYLTTPIVKPIYPSLSRRRGEQNHGAKLSSEQVRAIRAANGTLREIATRFGSTLQNVSTIRSGRSWKHLV